MFRKIGKIIRINKLQIDLLRRHVGPFLFCFFTLMFLLLMQFLIQHIESLIGKDIPVLVIIDLILTNLAFMVVLAVPMAVLVATLMAFGKFSELNELTALRASGVNPFTIIRPVLIASVLMFLFLGWFSNYVLPEANHRARSLFIDIRLKKPGFDLKPNIFYDGIENYTFLVDRVDEETDSLYGITLFQEASTNQDRAYIRAEKGLLVNESGIAINLHLYNGEMVSFPVSIGGTRDNMHRTAFYHHSMFLDLSDLSFFRSNPNERARGERTMSIEAMMTVVDSLSNEVDRQIDKMRIDTTDPFLSSLDNKESYFTLFQPGIQDTSSAESNLDTPYFSLNITPTYKSQFEHTNDALRLMEAYKSSMENTKNFVSWRLQRISQYLVEIHKKLSIPFACVVFVVFGAPIGIMTKRGNFGFAAIISAIVLTFYWISLIQGEKLADRLFISPFTGMWTFNLIFLTIGFILLARLTTGFRFKYLLNQHSKE